MVTNNFLLLPFGNISSGSRIDDFLRAGGLNDHSKALGDVTQAEVLAYFLSFRKPVGPVKYSEGEYSVLKPPMERVIESHGKSARKMYAKEKLLAEPEQLPWQEGEGPDIFSGIPRAKTTEVAHRSFGRGGLQRGSSSGI